MHSTYYTDLEINNKATSQQIAQAYRRLSLKWHPKLSKQNLNHSYKNFCKVSQAYEVLSDRQKRQIYDKFGELILKQGFNDKGTHRGGYRFSGNPQEIFEKFFGTKNPYQPLFEKESNKQAHSIFSSLYPKSQLSTPKDLVVLVECTLTQLYNGCKKNITYRKQILNKDQRTVSEVTESKQIQIKAGMANHSKIIHKGHGNQSPGIITTDLIFQIEQHPEKGFKREGNNLIYTAPITLIDALTSKPFSLTTLSGQILNISFDQVISQRTVRQIKGQGMPILNENSTKVQNYGLIPRKGDLIIKFDIIFPESLSQQQKSEINLVLQDTA